MSLVPLVVLPEEIRKAEAQLRVRQVARDELAKTRHMTDHATTLALVDAMRARGVRTFTARGDLLHVEFGPVETPLRPETKGMAADPERCACGCPLAGHMGGMCVTAGCEPAKCAGEVKT